MTKDCNGCFGAAGDDCQRCQEVDEVTPHKLDITPQLAIAAYNTLIDYCKKFDSEGNCGNCIFDQIRYIRTQTERISTVNQSGDEDGVVIINDLQKRSETIGDSNSEISGSI